MACSMWCQKQIGQWTSHQGKSFATCWNERQMEYDMKAYYDRKYSQSTAASNCWHCLFLKPVVGSAFLNILQNAALKDHAHLMGAWLTPNPVEWYRNRIHWISQRLWWLLSLQLHVVDMLFVVRTVVLNHTPCRMFLYPSSVWMEYLRTPIIYYQIHNTSKFLLWIGQESSDGCMQVAGCTIFLYIFSMSISESCLHLQLFRSVSDWKLSYLGWDVSYIYTDGVGGLF